MDITKFCATNDPRSYMHKPMRHDGYLYATNGHIAVRIADDPAIEAGPMPQNLQNGILQKMAYDTEERAWQPVPVIDKANLRDTHASLRDWTWENRYDPGFQLTAIVEMNRSLWRRIAANPGATVTDQWAFVLSSYNGGRRASYRIAACARTPADATRPVGLGT